MQEMLDDEDEHSTEEYARVAREQATSEAKWLGLSHMFSPSAS